MGTAVRDLRQEVSSFLTAFDAELLTGDQAAVAVAEFSCIEKMAATGRMLAATRVSETAAWQGEGDKSAADWLARKAGTSVGEAAGVLGTGKKTKKLPKTRRAMRKGKLSAAQAKAVADGADADPDAEDDLLGTAEKETFQNLKRKSQKIRAAATDDQERDRRIRAARSCRSHVDGDGAFNLHLRGPAVDGARLLALWKPLQEQRFRDARRLGSHDTFDNRAYDAFLDLIFSATGGLAPSDSPATPGGETAPDAGRSSDAADGSSAQRAKSETSDPPASATGLNSPSSPCAAPGAPLPTSGYPPSGGDGPSPPNGTGPPPRTVPPPERAAPPSPAGTPMQAPDDPVPPRAPPGGVNTKVIVRIDHSALLRGHSEPGETVEIVGLGQVSVATVKKLMGDAFIAAVVMKGRDVLNVAHLGRGTNAFQRTALEAVNVACSNLACNRTVGIEIDHRVPWIQHRETSLANQDPLCVDDHRKKTHEGWMLVAGSGRRLFVPPGHPRHPGSPGQPAPEKGLRSAPTGPEATETRDCTTPAGRTTEPVRRPNAQFDQATLS